MEASTQNSTNPTLRHLNAQVPEQAQPPLIAPARSSQSEPLPSLNQAGSLAGPSVPASIGLRSRQVQEGSAGAKIIRQCMYEASQLLKQGKLEEAGAMYISLLSNTEVYIRDRLNCAKKLLNISPINSQAPKAAHLLVEIAQDANIEWADRLKAIKILVKHPMFQDQAGNTLVGMVKDTKLADTDRLKAIKILAKWPRLQEKAVAAFKAFAAVFESEAIETWVQNAVRDRIVPLLFSRVKDIMLFPTNRIDAAEELSKLVGEDQQGEVWSALIKNNLVQIDGRHGMKIAEKLAKIRGYEDQAADYLLPLARNRSQYIFLSIKAAKKLSKIPGYETTAAELLIALSEIDHNHINHHAGYFNRCKGAEVLSAIPGQEEKAAAIWLAIAQEKRTQGAMLYAAQKLSRMPGQEEKAKAAWLCLADRKDGYAPGIVICRSASARALLELFGEKDKAVEVFIDCAENEKETPDRRMLAVDNLARIPGQEAKVEELKKALEKAQEAIIQEIETARSLLQNPEEKEKAAQALLTIAKNVAVLFTQRMLAIDTLLEIQEQHSKAIEALKFIAGYKVKKDEKDEFIAGDKTLYQYHWLLAAEKLSKIPGQEDQAYAIVDSYVYKISDESRYFKF